MHKGVDYVMQVTLMSVHQFLKKNSLIQFFDRIFLSLYLVTHLG